MTQTNLSKQSCRHKLLLESEDNWVTDMGAWIPGERVIFRGQDLLNDLSKRSWFEIWLKSITSKEFSDAQINLWNRMWIICSSFPEPRLWNNRVAALAASSRATPSLAMAAATAVSEATIYGRQADVAAFDFIRKFAKQAKLGESIDSLISRHIKQHRMPPPGYGRPLVSVDERIPPVRRLAEELGFDKGRHYMFANSIDDYLLSSKYRWRMNVGGLAAAISADQELTLREYSQFIVLVFSAGNMACYVDAVTKPSGTFFPLRCDRIAYQGHSGRIWEN